MSPKAKSQYSHLRVYVIGLVLLLVPTAVLVYLGYKQVTTQAQSMEIGYHDLLKQSITLVEDNLLALEKKNLDRLNKLGKTETGLSRFAEPEPEAHDLFYAHFALNQEGVRLLPLGWDDVEASELPQAKKPIPPAGKKIEVISGFSAVPSEFSTMYQNLSAGDISKTIKVIKKILSKVTNPEQKFEPLLRLAGCYFTLKDYPQAIATYEQFLQEYPLRNRYHVLSQYQLGLGQALLKDFTKASEVWLVLYQGLIDIEKITVTEEIRKFYLAKVKSALKEYCPTMLQSPAYLALEEKETQIRRQAETIRILEELVIPKIKNRLTDLPLDTPINFLLSEKQCYLLCLGKNSVEEPRIWGFLVSIERLNHEITSGLGKLAQGGYQITSTEGRRIISSQIVLPPEGNSTVITEGFIKTFPLKIDLYLGESVQQKIRNQVLLYTIFLAIMLIGLGTGIYLLIKSTIREVKLARMKSDFVSTVSHELRTPLSLIRMYGELLEFKYAKNDGEKQKYYEVITRESKRLTQLINNVLDFSRIDAERKEYHLIEDNLAAVVENTIAAFKTHLTGKEFTIKTNFASDLPLVKIDKDAISQMVLNLLDNAVKYSKDEKYIEINLKKVNTQIELEIIDTGIGIDPKHFDKIFERFYRIESGLTRETRGTGLGLALVKHIAEAHEATVEVKSKVGQGSTFTVKFPC